MDTEERSGAWRHRRPSRRGVQDGLLLLVGVLVLATGAVILIGGLGFDTVTSGSMRPGIQPGDLAVLQRVEATQLVVGDVIAYVPPAGSPVEGPLLHRIVSLTPGAAGVSVQTKGDANNVNDFGPVRLASTGYRMVAVIPYLGWLIYLRGFMWLFVGAGVLVLGVGTLSGALKNRRQKQEGVPSRALPASRL